MKPHPVIAALYGLFDNYFSFRATPLSTPLWHGKEKRRTL